LQLRPTSLRLRHSLRSFWPTRPTVRVVGRGRSSRGRRSSSNRNGRKAAAAATEAAQFVLCARGERLFLVLSSEKLQFLRFANCDWRLVRLLPLPDSRVLVHRFVDCCGFNHVGLGGLERFCCLLTFKNKFIQQEEA